MRKSLIILVILCLALVSCGGKKPTVKKVDNPADLYVDGVKFMKAKKYDKAIENFGKVRENFPFDPIALIAQVKQADSHFQKKDYLVAAGIYEDFVNSYPDDENAAYALRRVAECYENLTLTNDRDQANTFKAVERFTFLKNRYPQSPYSRDADVHLKNLNDKLAARELYVGEFYYKWGKYNASILRLNYFLEKYPNAEGRDKALYYLAEDYRELHNPEKAAFYLDKLRQEFPGNTYGRPMQRLKRKTLGATHAPGAEPAAPVPVAQASAGHEPRDGDVPARPAVPDLSYSEAAVREIDLRPVQPAARVETASIDAGQQVTEGAQSTDMEARPAPLLTPPASQDAKQPPDKSQAKGNQPSPNTGTAESVRKGGADAGMGASRADAEKDAAKKSPDKKNSLGFFSEKKPVDVVADTMEGLEKGKIAVFRGNVVAKQVDLYLFADTLTAYMNEETNEIDRAKAEGNVKIVKLDRTATCREAYFYNDRGEIILKGDVVVFTAKDRVSGDVITYYINEDRVHVQGEKERRAKAVITPK
jgi:outer membrane protein assembly factor BamD